ncbi:MAG: EpsG family protein [Paludibacteraceae bacterium]|nr:EpsG family protein [Paludibacteraceae bacterium]
MNLITLILTIAILFGLTDFLTERYPRLQRDIFWIAWFVITFLFTIKYYYGADIWHYGNFYQDIQNPSYVLHHPTDIPQHFEIGYALFCSVLKNWGVSFYWHTAIISILYFTVIAVLFTRIERKRSFALAILVVLDYNCIFATYRQCLAITCFLWMVLCLQERKYLLVTVLAALTIAFHKSGAFVVSVVLFYYMVRSKWVQPYMYQLMLVILILVFLLPIAHISSSFISHLPIPETYADSLIHHLQLGRQVQVIFLVYAAALVVIAHFSQYRHSRAGAITAAALVGLVIVVLLYQYYYLLGRIRSFFLPLVIVYIFSTVQKAEDEPIHVPYGTLLKQLCSVLLFLYMGHSVYAFNKNAQLLKHKIYTACTVFDLIDHRACDVQNTQMKKARLWWEEDFMNNTGNQLK